MRRVAINGNVTLMDYCDGSPDYASGGFIADSSVHRRHRDQRLAAAVLRPRQRIDGWSNGVWNQVFCGDPGAPAQSFAANSGDSGGPAPYTTLATCPATEEEPYLYTDSVGQLQRVRARRCATNSNGPSWANGNTAGHLAAAELVLRRQLGSSVAQINAALAAGDNLLFTPGVYQYAHTINVHQAEHQDRRPRLPDPDPDRAATSPWTSPTCPGSTSPA